MLFECEIETEQKTWQSVHSVIARLEDEMVGYGSSQGEGGQQFSPGSFSQLFLMSVHLEAQHYEHAIRWVNTVQRRCD